MPNDSIVSLIDAEISKLKQARILLAKTGKVSAKITAHIAKTGKVKKAAGKGKIAKTKAVKTAVAKTKKRRALSPEARQRIADAQRKRWAAQKSKA
jgi:hypothetical protein